MSVGPRSCEQRGEPVTLIDSAMAAHMLTCSVRHVRNLVNAGTITNHGDGWRILIDLHELTALINEGHVTPNPRPKKRKAG